MCTVKFDAVPSANHLIPNFKTPILFIKSENIYPMADNNLEKLCLQKFSLVRATNSKTGRSITGFSFKFKQKPQTKIEKVIDPERNPSSPDFFIKLSDPQRHLFANKMSEMPEMSKYSRGTESFQQFAIRIADMLLEPEKFRELYQYLEKAGFKP